MITHLIRNQTLLFQFPSTVLIQGKESCQACLMCTCILQVFFLHTRKDGEWVLCPRVNNSSRRVSRVPVLLQVNFLHTRQGWGVVPCPRGRSFNRRVSLVPVLFQVYFLHTREGWGVGTLPQGKEFYQACLKWYLSLNMTPDEVHQLGLREVARTEAQMQGVRTLL